MPNTYDLIKTTTLVSNQASVTFTSTDFSNYDDLCIMSSAKTDATTATVVNDSIKFVINSDTGNNYEGWRIYQFSGTTGGDKHNASQGYGYASYINFNSNPANSFSNNLMYITNNKNTNFYKTILAHGYMSTNLAGTSPNPYSYASMTGNVWLNSAIITNIVLSPLNGSNFISASSFSLYGIKYT
jgi:hypothetical protein